MKYFTMEEFACKHCGELPAEGMNPVLLEALDELREEYGRPIYLTSAYRCEYHNAEVGGVPDSQHTLGNAVDMIVDGDFTEFALLCERLELFDGLGIYWEDEFVHADMRNNGITPNYYRW